MKDKKTGNFLGALEHLQGLFAHKKVPPSRTLEVLFNVL